MYLSSRHVLPGQPGRDQIIDITSGSQSNVKEYQKNAHIDSNVGWKAGWSCDRSETGASELGGRHTQGRSAGHCKRG